MAKPPGKVAWITGAGSGIGEAAAYALAQDGASIVLTGRRLDTLGSVAASIRSHGGTAHVQVGDVTLAADVETIAR